MLDNILHQVRRSAERVQRRGEELTQSARLRLEVFQLGRELEGLYTRLGRAYHAAADLEVLRGLQDDIRRVDEEISARERLIQELGSESGEQESEFTPAPVTAMREVQVPPRPSTHTEPNIPTATPRPQETTMTDRDSDRPVPTTPDPTVQRSDELLVPGDATANQGDDLGRESREKAFTHKHQLEEGHNASKNPDPLDL